MSDFVIHGVPGSPFMRAVAIAMEEKNQPYRVAPLAPGATRTPEYMKMHPFARVPVITHGDFQLYETQAILRYIDALFPSPSLQPSAPQDIARMNQIIGINDWYLFPQVGRVLAFQRVIGPVLMGLKPDEAACAAAVPDAKICLGELERLLGGKPYLIGDQFTLADIVVAPHLDYIAMTPEGASILNGTRLAAWLKRVNARPSFKATLPPENLRKAA